MVSKTKIEWCDYTINPVKGLCPMACSYCYARRMYKRFKWNPEIRFEPEEMLDLGFVKNGKRVFIGSTIELFHESIPDEWIEEILWYINRCYWATCILLTKQPQNLIKWSPFPKNCWVGVTITGSDNNMSKFASIQYMRDVQASVKYISFEPLLESICIGYRPLWWADKFQESGINWVIIGQQTPVKKSTMPKINWIQDILVACDNPLNIPVFMKNNLQPLLNESKGWQGWKLRQEFPK